MQKLTEYPLSSIKPRMGRPPLNNKPTLVRLPESAMERIDALVGQHRRSAFIREAVERELKRRERHLEEKGYLPK
jgi:Arc/MetJ-type ribon-helix-helix transcriptional regulator